MTNKYAHTNPKHCQFCRMHNSGDHVVGCPNAKYPSEMPLEFMACDTCRAKPGSPPLCAGCLHNRYVIDELRISDKDAWDPTTGRWIRPTRRKDRPMTDFNGPHLLTDAQGYMVRCCGHAKGCKWCAAEASKPEAAPMLLEDISYEGEGWAILQCGGVTVKLGCTLLNIIVACLDVGTRTASASAAPMMDVARVMDAFIAVNNESAEGRTPPDWSEE
jgi:hypothetical protein